MDRIFSVCEAASQVGEEILVHALQCLREISTLEYESIQWYFDRIWSTTSQLAEHPAPEVGAQAYEFWTTLTEDETERKLKNVTLMNYVVSGKDSLIQLILRGLLVTNFEEDEDGEDWGHALSAGTCLQKLAVLIGNDVMRPVLDYVDANISTNNWH